MSKMRKTLPKGWKMVRLGDVVERKTEQILPFNYPAKEFTYIGLEHIESNTGNLIKCSRNFGKEIKSNKIKFQEGDILYGKLRPYLNKVWLADTNGICSTDIWVLRPKKNILHGYLFSTFLRSREIVNLLNSKTEGANLPRVKASYFNKLLIPLPPLSTQHKIVEILEEADNLRKLRQQADEKMKDLIPSLFVEMFGDPATNPKGWEQTELSNISIFKRGPFGGSLKKEIFVQSGFKVYEQKNAIYNDFEIGSYYIDQEKYKEMISFAVKPGDLIVSCSGTMGRVAIVPQGVQEGIINQALLKITPNYEMVTSLYLKLLIESEGIQRKYFRNAAGSAIQNVASVGTLKKIIAPLPPLPLQQEFAKLVEEIEAEKARQAESKKKLDELFNSLLQRAFKGELVG